MYNADDTRHQPPRPEDQVAIDPRDKGMLQEDSIRRRTTGCVGSSVSTVHPNHRYLCPYVKAYGIACHVRE